MADFNNSQNTKRKYRILLIAIACIGCIGLAFSIRFTPKAHAATISYLIDFGRSTIQTTTTGWNNIIDPRAGSATSLVNSTGAATSATLQITDAFYFSSTPDFSTNINGTTSSTLYPSTATNDSFFLGTLSSVTDNAAAFTIGGLNNTSTYDFRFYASRVAGDAGNRTGSYTIGGTTVTLNATDNVNNYIDITGVSPTSGSISISVAKASGASFAYLGVLEITEHTTGNASPTAQAGTDQAIVLPTTTATLSGSGTDTDGTIASYAWAFVSGPTTASITSASSASTGITGLTLAGTYTFRLTVTDNLGATGTDDIAVVAEVASGETAHNGIVGAIPGTIQAEDFDDGGEGVAYHDTDVGNNGTQYRTSENVDIENASDTSGTYDIGWTAAGEYLNYTVTVATTGTYTLGARIAAPAAGGTILVYIDTNSIGTVNVPQTGGYQTWQTATLTNLSLTAGSHLLTMYVGVAGFNMNYFTFTLTSNAPPTAIAGDDQTVTLPTTTATLSGSGTDTDGTIASYAWSFLSGPTTASITSASTASTGITGLTLPGTYTFRLTVTDNLGATGTDDIAVLVFRTNNSTSYLIDFGRTTSTMSNSTWNDFTNPTAGSATALVNANGSATSLTLQITNSFYYDSGQAMDISINNNGTTSSTVYPANATHDAFFVGTLNSITDNTASIAIAGLNDSNTYDFRFYGSRVAGDGANRTTDYTINGTTVTLNATDNVNNYIDLTDISPTSGSIAITIAKDAVASFGYLGVLEITEHSSANQPPVAHAGNNHYLQMPVSTITLFGSGTDNDGTIASYAWTETTSNYATINDPSSATTSVTDLAPGTYTFRLTVTDNNGATDTDDMDVNVIDQNIHACTAKTIVVLGSSTSAGYGITPSSDAYVNRFATYFDGLLSGNSVVNLAVSGYTTYHILPTGSSTANRPAPDTAHNITQALTYDPDAIIVNMPSNDTANSYTASEQEVNFQTLKSTADAAGVPIWFTTTQPRNFSQQSQLDEQATVRDWIKSTYGTHAIDFWTTFATSTGTINPTYDQGDGIHLIAIGHKKLYARVANSNLINTICDTNITHGGGLIRNAGGETDNGTGAGTCADGIQNGNETGIDTGGRCVNTGGGTGGGSGDVGVLYDFSAHLAYAISTISTKILSAFMAFS